jgi:transcriptional regulator with XRE-family HTH domain
LQDALFAPIIMATCGVEAMPAKPPNPVDVYVGGRVRMRRVEIGMSQQTLGEQIDLTFQQIQKYEKGMNRIGASRLQQIGKILGVPASYFFEGAPGGREGAESGGSATGFLELLGTRDGQALIGSFSKIPDAELRRSIVHIVEHLAKSDPPMRPRRAKPKRK